MVGSAHLVFDGTEETRLLFGGVASLVEDGNNLQAPGSLFVEGGSIAQAMYALDQKRSKGGAGLDAYLAWRAPVRARANMVNQVKVRERS